MHDLSQSLQDLKSCGFGSSVAPASDRALTVNAGRSSWFERSGSAGWRSWHSGHAYATARAGAIATTQDIAPQDSVPAATAPDTNALVPVTAAIANPTANPTATVAATVTATVTATGITTVTTTDTTATATAQSLAYSSIYGYGKVDAAAALAALGLPAKTTATALALNDTGTVNVPLAGIVNDVASASATSTFLNAINAPQVWAQGYTGQGVVVAVVDSGADYTHADLKDNIWINPKEIAGNGIDDDNNGFIDDTSGWDFVNNDNTPLDGTGHGTHVAGIIAGEQNSFGVTGVAYNAKIMPVRVLDDQGNSSYARIAEGVYYAVNNGANIINLSLGGSSTSAVLQAAIQYANDRGVLVVAAAGNNGGTSPMFPGSLANQLDIAVGAVDLTNQMPSFSARSGPTPINYVVAPGVDIYSTLPGNSYGLDTGTSMSAAEVSGVAALLLSAKPTLTPAQLIQIITSTANPTGIAAYTA